MSRGERPGSQKVGTPGRQKPRRERGPPEYRFSTLRLQNRVSSLKYPVSSIQFLCPIPPFANSIHILILFSRSGQEKRGHVVTALRQGNRILLGGKEGFDNEIVQEALGKFQ